MILPTYEQFLDRKIFLKRQAIGLIKKEIRNLQVELFCLQIKSLTKRLVIWCFNRGILNFKSTQWFYDRFRLKAS